MTVVAAADRFTQRERQRAKGQFWTPDWVAQFMVAYALEDRPAVLLDPAVGSGVFFRAARAYATQRGFRLTLNGCDIDPEVITQARRAGVPESDLQHIAIRDFVLDPPREHYPAIVANPPYIRHHRLTPEVKQQLREFARRITGRRLDGRAGLHVYFLLRTLQCLSPGGRLAYLVSSDVCEGVFAQPLWAWITSQYRLDAVVTFAPEATPFPNVDVNVLVFCLRRLPPAATFLWVRCRRKDATAVEQLLTQPQKQSFPETQWRVRAVNEALLSGFSRPPRERETERFTLGDWAVVKRGVATGDNGFFFLTLKRLAELGIPPSFSVPAIGRVRDVAGDTVTPEDLDRLESRGRPTRLLALDGERCANLPPPVQAYLREGERLGIPNKPLVRTRKPWYRLEKRAAPPFLFTYLGRRRPRFIRNDAGVVPLNCWLCVYPRHPDPDFLERFGLVLADPLTLENLAQVGKFYGNHAVKVEPRALEQLPLPSRIVHAHNLTNRRGVQSVFQFKSEP